jgi:signal transduction histidine kinase
VLGTVTVVHDVTLEKELDRMKEEIVSSISHDLRSPISSIMGFLDFLKKGVAGVLNERQKEMVESMLRSAGRLLAMVNNILDVARLDSQAVQVKLARASLAGLAGRAIETLNAIAQRRGISVELQAEEEFSVDVDAEQIERVFANLISNALKFSPDDARIVVSLRHDEERIEASVEDQGPGIPAQYLERVFEKFEQVPGTRHGGTGLGLTICRRFVEAHGGRIWAESAPGKGARFRFTIPKSPFRERIDVR